MSKFIKVTAVQAGERFSLYLNTLHILSFNKYEKDGKFYTRIKVQGSDTAFYVDETSEEILSLTQK